MKLSPKALRIVSFGVSQLGAAQKKAWQRWIDRHPNAQVSPEIAPIIDSALVALEHIVLEAAANKSKNQDADKQAEIINDMGFIHAIHSDLKKKILSHSRH